MDTKEIVASNLKELRIKKGIYQKELAEALGVKQATVARYESGVAAPSLEVLVAYADYFNVSMDVIFGRKYRKLKASLPETQKIEVDVKSFEELKQTILDFIQQVKQ